MSALQSLIGLYGNSAGLAQQSADNIVRDMIARAGEPMRNYAARRFAMGQMAAQMKQRQYEIENQNASRAAALFADAFQSDMDRRNREKMQVAELASREKIASADRASEDSRAAAQRALQEALAAESDFAARERQAAQFAFSAAEQDEDRALRQKDIDARIEEFKANRERDEQRDKRQATNDVFSRMLGLGNMAINVGQLYQQSRAADLAEQRERRITEDEDANRSLREKRIELERGDLDLKAQRQALLDAAVRMFRGTASEADVEAIRRFEKMPTAIRMLFPEVSAADLKADGPTEAEARAAALLAFGSEAKKKAEDVAASVAEEYHSAAPELRAAIQERAAQAGVSAAQLGEADQRYIADLQRRAMAESNPGFFGTFLGGSPAFLSPLFLSDRAIRDLGNNRPTLPPVGTPEYRAAILELKRRRAMGTP